MNKLGRLVTGAAAFCALCVFPTITPCQAQDAKTRARNVLERHQPDDYANVSRAEKGLLRAEFKRYKLEDGEQGVYSWRATRELVKLGDSETIEHYMREFLEKKRLSPARRAAKMLELASDPNIIPKLADQIFAEDGVEPVAETHVFVSPKSILATNVIIAIGARAPELSQGVRESLKRLAERRPEERRATVRRWWRENQSAFTAQQYSRVTPAQ